jgi:ubiquinone/menaquinone biosynthesis C-methylase UbiE
MQTRTPMLLDRPGLERSEFVANARMNRERNLSGANSYEKDLGLAPLGFLTDILERKSDAAWLDLCCGAGRALLQASAASQSNECGRKIKFTGVDLVPMFDPASPSLSRVRLVCASVETWETEEKFDLITCVHGLHYIGDKLGVLQRASRWLNEDGRLMMHIDYRNLKVSGQQRPAVQVGKALRRAGFGYLSGRHLLVRVGNVRCDPLPYRYLGADDKAGPNFTGQPAVDSYYERIGT